MNLSENVEKEKERTKPVVSDVAGDCSIDIRGLLLILQ
jgi:hypothetical protein